MMDKGTLLTEKAHEPHEEARQPLEESMTPRMVGQPTRKVITFADDTDMEKSSSQKSSNYKDLLSQPAPGLSHRQKMLWLQKRRQAGLWVQCDDCNRWRFLSNVLDSYDLPTQWYCRLNPDRANADCSVPEAPIRIRDEEDLIHSEYSAGSVVWARMPGWPWWPAMVDDCPDTEQFYWLDGFSDIPTHYNVVFFDSTDVTRGWIAPESLKPYTANKNSLKPFLKDKKYNTRLQAAVTQADDATKLSLADRLEKYSFIARYKGALNSPKKVNKKDLEKYEKMLKRKYNIEIEDTKAEVEEIPKSPVKHKNVIVLGTPKRVNTRTKPTTEDTDATDSAPVGEKLLNENGPLLKPLETKMGTPKRVKTRAKRTTQDVPNSVPVTKKLVNENGPTVKPLETSQAEPELEIGNATELNGQTELNTDSSTNDVFKRPSSLAVQMGSNNDWDMVDEPFDDDTSKTYVPEKESQESTQLTIDTVTSDITDFRVTISSPRSDDFDF